MALSASLVASLFGGGTGAAATADAAGAGAALKVARTQTAEDKGIAAERKDPVTINALKRFDAALAAAKDEKAALREPRVLEVLLPALGLADQAAYPGLVLKALLADPKDSKGLLASLDERFKAAVETLDLRGKGLAGLRDPATRKTIADGYVEYQYKRGLDDKTTGMSDALYYLKSAGKETNVYNILGNSVLRRVVTTALGLPPQLAVQSVESQARAITARLKLADLQDPRKVELLAQRYLMARANEGGGAASPALSLLA